ncbi:MAG: outer membrane protein transport protein [Deltaproteobacteria bacterium]|nr:outer membrane protein transport protein [Deltaproteobacteria bacterium]
MKGWKMLPVLLVLLLTASTAFASGFRLPEAGAKAMGMGFAFAAQADDPSAIYFNPAGLTQLKGNNLKLGVTYVKENGGTFSGTTPLSGGASISETQKDLDFFIPNFFYANSNPSTGIAWGVGVFAPFGLGQEYENRNTSYFRNQITKIDLQTIVVNPTIAFKVNDVLSVGVGVDFLYGKAKLEKTGVVFLGAPGNVNLYNLGLDGDGTAWGYNFGILVNASKEVKIGFNYRSPFHLEIKDGDVDISNINSTVPFVPNPGPGPATLTAAQVFGGTSYSTKGSTKIEIPATATLGVSYTKNRLTLEVDADMTFWSSYSALNIDIQNNNPLLPDSKSQKNWKDVVAVYVGGEYRVTDPLALRLGIRYDPNPAPDQTLGPELPDADKMYYCAGLGYKYSNWIFDVAYMYVDKKDRSVWNQTAPAPPSTGSGFGGTWGGDAHLVSLDVGYRF